MTEYKGKGKKTLHHHPKVSLHHYHPASPNLSAHPPLTLPPSLPSPPPLLHLEPLDPQTHSSQVISILMHPHKLTPLPATLPFSTRQHPSWLSPNATSSSSLTLTPKVSPPHHPTLPLYLHSIPLYPITELLLWLVRPEEGTSHLRKNRKLEHTLGATHLQTDTEKPECQVSRENPLIFKRGKHIQTFNKLSSGQHYEHERFCKMNLTLGWSFRQT